MDKLRTDICRNSTGQLIQATDPDAAHMRQAADRLWPAFISREESWRCRPSHLILRGGRTAAVGVTRFVQYPVDVSIENVSDVEDDAHVLTVLLRKSQAELIIGNRCVLQTHRSDRMYMTGPKHGTWRSLAHSHFECLRVFLSQEVLRECYEERHGALHDRDLSFFQIASVEDPVLRHLAQCFVETRGYDERYGPCFLDCLGLAFASRLVELHARGRLIRGAKPSSLSSDRMRLVKDYIEANLSAPLQLAELSAIAGLSRLHFARQFKLSTGLSPYAYILERRIERAQQLLAHGAGSIVEIALQLGFGSQGHFTTVFRKRVGFTPAAWRKNRS